MKRILYCESNTDGTVGGSHYCLLYLLQHLDRSRFTPTVVFYDDHAIVPKFRAVAETLVLEKDQPSQASPAVLRRAINLGKLAGKIASQVAFLRRHRIDLVHLNNSITRHHDWMIAARLAGLPCVVHERGLPQYGTLDRALGARVSAIIPMSRWIGRAMIEQGVAADNIRVMYDGLDPAGFTAAQPAEAVRTAWNVRPEQPVIGIVGNIRHWKGQETVARALVDIAKVHPDVVCFFVGATTPGDKPYFDEIMVQLVRDGLEGNVRFTGFQENVAQFTALMQVVIHASVHPEPFGMVVLEAMARRKPVVGSRAGGVVEMVVDGQTGYTFPPGDAATLAARVSELLSDPAKAVAMGERGYQRLLQDFSVDKYMNDLHGAYEAIFAHRPLPPAVPLTAEVP